MHPSGEQVEEAKGLDKAYISTRCPNFHLRALLSSTTLKKRPNA